MFPYKMSIFAYLFLLLTAISLIQAKRENVRNPINQYSIEFYKETSDLNPNKNVVMSPLSTQILLGLLSAAAKGNTRRQIHNALHMNNTNTIKSLFKSKINKLSSINGVTLNIANKIYVKDGEFYELAPNFKYLAEDSFKSEIENINFLPSNKAASKINDWVETETRHKIKKLISEELLNVDTRAVLINAIYFQGNWENPFDQRFTSKQQFLVSHSENVQVDMMYQEDYFPYLDSSELDSQILSLPYKSSNSSLIIILPKTQSDFKSLERKIVSTNLNNLLKNMHIQEVNVALPKFNITTKIDLKEVLPKLGVDLIFDQNEAELDGILKNKEKLFISDAIQKAFIEVNERGTEAAAATAFHIQTISAPLIDIYFTANRPFLYALVYEEDIIFCGKFLGK